MKITLKTVICCLSLILTTVGLSYGQDGTGVVTVTPVGGSCLGYTPSQSGGPDNWEVAQGGTYNMTIAGVTECAGNTITVFIQSSSTGNFCFNATGGGGTYSGNFTMPNPACNTMPVSYKCGASQACDNPGSFNANGASNTNKVHLRAATFASGCGSFVSDINCNPDCIPVAITGCTPGSDLGCNPVLMPSISPTFTGTNASVSGPSDDVSNVGCAYTLTRTWTVTGNCGGPLTCVQVYTWNTVSSPVLADLPDSGDLGCNPPAPSCSNGATASNECGSVPVLCTPGAVMPSGCNRSQTFTYSATDACSGLSTSEYVNYIWSVASDLTFENLPTGSDLGCNPATLPACDEDVTASNECGAATVVCTPGAVIPNGCNRSQTFNYHASTTCGGDADEDVTYTWTVVTAPVLANLPVGGALGCNPVAPVCSNDVTASNECGPLQVSCNPCAIVSNGCNRSQKFTYTVTDACSGLSTSADVNYTWSVSTTLNIAAGGPTNICSGSCVLLSATTGFGNYQWYLNGSIINGATNSTYSVCATGTYSVTATNNCGCSSTSNNVTVNVYATPTCSLPVINENDFPVANSNGNQICAQTSGGSNNTYSWTLVSSNNSWSITGSSTGLCLNYNAGTPGSTATFTFVVTAHYYGGVNCSSIPCTITLTTEAHEQCSYTQGFYGQSTGKISCSNTITAPMVIAQALSSGNIVLGNPAGTRRLTLTAADVNCIVSRMPGNSGADTLDVKSPSGWTCSNFSPLNGTKFKNVLVGQTLALTINTRLYPDLLNYHLTSSTFTTSLSADCNPATDITVPNSAQTFTIPAAVISCLGNNPANNTVAKLLELANKTLGGQPLGCVSGTATQSQINDAVTAINEGFDKCRIISGYNIREASQTVEGIGGFSFTYHPNPTNGITKATFVAPADGNATIQVYNLAGELVKTVYSENVSEGNSYSAEFDATLFSEGVYFIRATVGSNTAHGKLVIVK